ncbi:MAG TPA: hypothetical protein VFB08_05015 [Burkholderiales bacterium]|nr:hypothetical protein [Burkholderiales bacterium]
MDKFPFPAADEEEARARTRKAVLWAAILGIFVLAWIGWKLFA